MKNVMTKTVFAMLAVAVLAGCQDIKQELGVGRNSPDEFLVVKRAPLTLPPDYTLRAPGAGDAPSRSQAVNTARAALMGGSASDVTTAGSDSAFLSKIGTQDAKDGIRATIDEDNGYIALQNQTIGDKLIFWKDAAPESDRMPASVINSKAEAERLKKNKQDNKPVNDGDVPVIEKKQSTIDKLF